MEQKKIKKLSPCPFCGGEAVFRSNVNSSSRDNIGFKFSIKCSKCNVELPNIFKVDIFLNDCGEITPTIDERPMAIVQWNRREYPDNLRQEVEK